MATFAWYAPALHKSRRDLDQYHLHLKRQKLAALTVFHAMANIRTMFHYLEKAQYIFIDPAAHMLLRVPPQPLPHVPDEEDIRRLLAYPKTTLRAGLRDRAFMEALYSTGARLEEMASVTVFDLNLERGLVKLFGKGRKERFAPLGRKACDWLRQYIKMRADLLGTNLDEEALSLAEQPGLTSELPGGGKDRLAKCPQCGSASVQFPYVAPGLCNPHAPAWGAPCPDPGTTGPCVPASSGPLPAYHDPRTQGHAPAQQAGPLKEKTHARNNPDIPRPATRFPRTVRGVELQPPNDQGLPPATVRVFPLDGKPLRDPDG